MSLSVPELRGVPEFVESFHRLDRRLTRFMSEHGTTILRVALGIVFVWFGALKVVGATPVHDLVAATVPWLPASVLVPALGVFEVAVGAGLLLGRALRLVLALFWAQLVGTFLVPLVRPDLAFQGGNPLLLTVEGEFVVKNLVLLAAGLVVGGRLRRPARPAASE